MIKRSIASLVTLLLVSLFSQHLWADTLTVNSEVKTVTVYKQGALVSRKAHVKVPDGVTILKLPMLSPVLDKKTIQVGITNTDISLGKVDVDLVMPNRAEISVKNDSLGKLSSRLADSLSLIESFSSVLDNERSILLRNNNIGGKKGFDAERLSGVAAYLRKDLDEIVDLQLGYKQKRKKFELERQSINQQIRLLDERAMMPKSVVYVSLVSKGEAETDVEITYTVKEAEWTPFYELRVAEDQPSLEVTKKVMVLQKSKEEWKDVKMTVTRTNPSDNNAKPELQRYTLPYNQAYKNSLNPSTGNRMIKVMGNVRDNKGSIEGVLVTCAETRVTTQTDASGFYSIMVPEGSQLTFTHATHNTKTESIRGNSMVINVTMNENSQKIYGKGIDIRGKVSDESGPLPGADVVDKSDPNNFETTDSEGNFEMSVQVGHILEISFLGYRTKTIKVTPDLASRVLNIVLEQFDEELEEILVETGYGKVRKSDRTGSVASVDRALAGSVSGVKVSSSGQPGAKESVRIHGVSSLTGASNPLYIVDGMPLDDANNQYGGNPLASINPEDILSMEVLRDASATAIYGSRAANGVIIITTKKGAQVGSGLYLSTFSKLQDYTAEATSLNTIPSDGSEHEALLSTESIPAKYSYYAAPKITPNVYMLAEVPHWRDYELLKGKLRIFLNNTYIGESFWTPNEIQDTLRFSVGVERNIAVERTMKSTNRRKNLLKNNKITREWLITVKNNKEMAVDINLEEQIPVATNDKAKVELIQSDSAKVNEKEGILQWNIHLAPGEKKEINVIYEVTLKNDYDYNKLLYSNDL